MNERTRALQKNLYAASIIVLVVGLCSALLIYRAAGDEPEVANGSQVVIIDGHAYTIAPSDSKQYMRDLERFGGKATVLFVEFEDWFDGLWHGRSLAVTVAWLSTFVSLGLLLVANKLQPPGAAGPDSERDGPSDPLP
jgi:hypothetical protein